jgi:hypothetical protein
MENLGEQIPVIAHNVYRPERPLHYSQYQPSYHTAYRSSKIPRTALRLQVKLKKKQIAKERKQIDLKTKEINWLIGKNPIYVEKINYSSTKQKSNLYGATE